jgi:hypothetical protein
MSTGNREYDLQGSRVGVGLANGRGVDGKADHELEQSNVMIDA